MTAVAVSGIVLAGGRSARFGSDKLAAEIDGRPLIELAIAALAAVSMEVIVVIAPGDDRPLPDRVAGIPIRRAHDDESFGGPLIGLLTGLEHAREPIAIVAGGDMPGLQPAVLGQLTGSLVADPDAGAAALVYRGRRQQLPVALRNGIATDVARRLLASGERSLQSLADALRVVDIADADWRPSDPQADTLRDIDRPADIPGK